MQYRILVTGACGMIGSKIIDRLLSWGGGYEVIGIDKIASIREEKTYTHLQIDLGEKEVLRKEIEGRRITHVIHLAALAHTAGVADLSWERYFHVNVVCAQNVFEIAAERKIPLLFSSTADVYGITKEIVDGQSKRNPIGNYAKSKCLAEDALFKVCRETPYTVMRFAPVYTEEIKRDIQKRYYLKYPKVAYKVGKGVEYEVLNINNLVSAVSEWIENADGQRIVNVKNEALMKTAEIIKEEKKAGRAKIVIWIPKWMMVIAFKVFRLFSPNGWKTYMLNKVVNPLRTR